MTKLELNKRNLTIISSAAIFLISLVVFLYLPLAGEIRKKGLEWNSLQDQLGVLQAKLRTIERSDVNKRLLRQSEVSALIDTMTKQGKALLINFKSLTQKEIKTIKEGCAVLPIQMELEGGYEQLGRFLGVLENLKDAIVTLEGFDIRGDDKTLPKISASLTVNIYLTKGSM